MTSGEKVRRLRFEKNVSNKEVAEAVGTSEPTISRWITENKKPKFDTIAKVAEYFGCSMDEMKDDPEK